MAALKAKIKAEAPPTVAKETEKVDSLRDFMLKLISERGDICYDGVPIAQLADNLAFIAKTRLGRNTVLEQSKFSLLLGDCQMFLLYDDILILKGNGSEEPCFAMDGLLEESMSLISKRMKQLDYPHLAIHLGRDTRYMMEDELRSGSARPEIQVEG